MDYKAALDFMYSRLPMFHRIGFSAYKETLENTIALDDHAGNPHTRFKTIHIAGTNGKGSVSHMLASVLQEAGYKTGLYTSPHLKDFRERIKINGAMIRESFVAGFIAENIDIITQVEPSFFEMTVSLAFQYFEHENVEIAVIETGMGGRLDSTNIITPLVSVITNIGLDHTQFLGTTLEEIAGEKAGIIKRLIPVVIGEKQEDTFHVFANNAALKRSPLWVASENYRVEYSMMTPERTQSMNVRKKDRMAYKDLRVDLLGLYQKKNVPAVLQVVDVLKSLKISITESAVRNGLRNVRKNTGLRGRWEEIGFNPLIVCDTGHNEPGIREVVEQIRLTPHRKLHFVMGMVNDKDPDTILPLLPKDATYYFTKADIPRALDENVLKDFARNHDLKGQSYPKVSQAVLAAKQAADKEDMIFIGGSTFVVGEALP